MVQQKRQTYSSWVVTKRMHSAHVEFVIFTFLAVFAIFLFSAALLPETAYGLGTDAQSTEPDTAAGPDDVLSELQSYQVVRDDTGTITAEFPAEWRDVGNGEWLHDGDTIGIYISGAPDLEKHFSAWFSSWDTPGIFLGYSESQVLQEDAVLSWLDRVDLSADCTYQGRSLLPQAFFRGSFDVWVDCGAINSTVLILAATPVTESYFFVVESLLVTPEDLAALNHLLDTLQIIAPGSDESVVNGDVAEFQLGIAFGEREEAARGRDDQDSVDPEALIKRQVDTSTLTYEYQVLLSEAINVLIPAAWTDSIVGDWMLNGESIGLSRIDSDDATGFQEKWGTAGVWTRTSSTFGSDVTVDEVLNSLNFAEACTYDDRYEHTHQIFGITYESKYDLWTGCGEAESILAVVAAESEPEEHFVLVEFQALNSADSEAFGVFLNSFFVGDPLALAQAHATEENSLDDVSDGGADENLTNEELTEPEPADAVEAGDPAGSEESLGGATVEIQDETGTMRLEVPAAWTEVASDAWMVEGVDFGRSLAASANLEAYDAGWDTPGVFMGVSDSLAALDVDSFLDFFRFAGECTFSERYTYENSRFAGAYDVWTDCGQTGNTFLVLALKPIEAKTPLVMINLLVEGESVDELARQIFGGFYVESSASAEAADSISGASGEAPEPVAKVLVHALNVRSGPGLEYAPLTAVVRDAELSVIGQSGNCNWLQVQIPEGNSGWVSGGEEYVELNVNCSTIFEFGPNPAASTAAAGSAEPSATEAIQQGCYLFQNQVGVAITVTMTRRSDGWTQTVVLAQDEEEEQCFDPGSYTYTVDAPSPWESTRGELMINPEDLYYFPIRTAEEE